MPVEHARAGVVHVLQDEIKSCLRHLLAVQQLCSLVLLLLQQQMSMLGPSQDCCLPAACAAAVCIC
jgi:hypothetical protein